MKTIFLSIQAVLLVILIAILLVSAVAALVIWPYLAFRYFGVVPGIIMSIIMGVLYITCLLEEFKMVSDIGRFTFISSAYLSLFMGIFAFAIIGVIMILLGFYYV